MMRTKNLKWWKKNQKHKKNSQPPVYCALHYLYIYIYMYRFITSDEPLVQSNMCVYYIWLSSSEDSYWNPSSSFRLIAFYEHVLIFLALPFDISTNNSEAYSLTASNHFRNEISEIFLNNFFYRDLRKLKHEDSSEVIHRIFQRWKKKKKTICKNSLWSQQIF